MHTDALLYIYRIVNMEKYGCSSYFIDLEKRHKSHCATFWKSISGNGSTLLVSNSKLKILL